MDDIRILQLGEEDWGLSYQIPGGIRIYHEKPELRRAGDAFELVFWDREPREQELENLRNVTKAYTLYLVEGVQLGEKAEELFQCKKGKKIAREQIQQFLLQEARNYYPAPYGEKFKPSQVSISKNFKGEIKWNGNYSVSLTGDFGEELEQAAFWRNNIPVFSGQAIDLWLEYKKSEDVRISMKITQFRAGALAEVQNNWEFTQEELENIVTIDNQKKDGPIFVSINACGKGNLQIIGLHDRYSRRGHGYFLPGGERVVTSDREEIFYYFDPGDRKPPLNVYFSGYKTREGFEGYNMMRRMGCPFLLISESRLEGGSFYMGSPEYEAQLVGILRKHMEELGFGADEVVLSGLSMGTFGALYYGCDISPHAMLLGKPLASIGDVAANERLNRPGGFPTSLDVLCYIQKGMDAECIDRLNHRFWDKFDQADWHASKFIVSYMIEDDYDRTAYQQLISHLQSGGVQVYGKGIHGRHNDDTGAIVKWFSSQYYKILAEDFHRGIE